MMGRAEYVPEEEVGPMKFEAGSDLTDVLVYSESRSRKIIHLHYFHLSVFQY